MVRLSGLMAGVVVVLLLFGTSYSEPSGCADKGTAKAGAHHLKKYEKHAGHSGHFWGRIFLQLDLSDEQRRKVSDIRLEYRKAMIRLGADIDVAEVELKELLMGEPVDLKAVKAKIQDIEELRGRRRFYRIERLQELKRLLTPRQKKRLDKLMPEDGLAGHVCRMDGPRVW